MWVKAIQTTGEIVWLNLAHRPVFTKCQWRNGPTTRVEFSEDDFFEVLGGAEGLLNAEPFTSARVAVASELDTGTPVPVDLDRARWLVRSADEVGAEQIKPMTVVGYADTETLIVRELPEQLIAGIRRDTVH
jgi:hypothetical protein